MIAALAAAASLACTPHPGLGTITYERSGTTHAVDLATCRDRRADRPAPRPSRSLVSPDGRFRAAFRTTGSNSLPADGVILRVVSRRNGRTHRIGTMLAYPDYLAWCGGRLVFTAGGDRVATDNKRLLAASAPNWRARPLVSLRGRAWGSLACAPDNRSVVVQSQPESGDANFFATRWALWRVGLDGTQTRLTSPPVGEADESPRFSPDARTLYFVRSRKGRGQLYALRAGSLLGPLLSFGYSLGYYGHQDWAFGVRRT